MPENNRRPEITMHSLRFGGGFAGLVFTVGSMLIFLIGLPSLWSFLALSTALGISVAVIFRLIARNRSARQQPLSILHIGDGARNSLGSRRSNTTLFRLENLPA